MKYKNLNFLIQSIDWDLILIILKAGKQTKYERFLNICLPLLKSILKPKFYWNAACLIFGKYLEKKFNSFNRLTF